VLISDGLSALAAQRQAPPLLTELLPRLRAAGLTLAPLCVVRHARVALLDEVGAVLRARLALILLGERPGLGTPDSLGAYFEFAPQPGRTHADRNCVSNIRPGQPSWLAGLPKNSPSCSPPHSPPSAAASRSRKRSHRRCWHVESRFPRGRTARRPYRRYCARR
jgi:hypothetical protein